MQGYRSNIVRLWAAIGVILMLTAGVVLAAERDSSPPSPEAGTPTTAATNPTSTSTSAPSALPTTTTPAPAPTLATDATTLVRESGPFGAPPIAQAPLPDTAPEAAAPEAAAPAAAAPGPATTTTSAPAPTTTTAPATTAAPTTTAAPAPTTTTTLPPTTTTAPPATTTTTAAPASGSYSPDAEAQFLSSINGVRSGAGLGGLSSDGGLKDYARSWARHMAETGSFAHSNIGSLLGPWSTVGENIGRGTSGVSAIFNALAASPPHYANMTNPSFTHVGVGVFVDASGEIWTAHVFGG